MLTNGPLIANLFLKSEEIRKISHDYLMRIFLENINDPQKVYALAIKVFKYADYMQIHEEHPIFQKAIQIRAIADPQALTNKRNPYRFHVDLKELVEKEKLIEFTPSKEKIENKTVSINLEALRKLKPQHNFTITDLPTNIPRNGFEQLCQCLEKRLLSLSKDKRIETENYICKCFIHPLEKLKEQFLNKPFIKQLLNIQGAPETPIEATAYYLLIILKAIWETDAQLKDPQLLTPQEEFFLRVFCSINECPTGQRDGITNYFNQLPIDYRMKIRRRTTISEAKAIHLVEHSIQKMFLNIFGSKELTQDIVGSSNTVLQPHQTLYSKKSSISSIRILFIKGFLMSTVVPIYEQLIDAPLCGIDEGFFKYVPLAN